MAAPTAPRKNFITRDHRYVYLGGSFIALLGLGMFYSAPSPYSFIPAQSVFGTALAAICWFFLGVSAMALLVKWAYWNNYSSTIMKRPLIVRVSRYLSYLDAVACALLVLDRFILKLAYIINAAIHADSNPTDTLSMMAYMAYNQRSLFAIGISYTVRLALFGTAIAFVLALLMVFLRIQEPDKRDNDFVKFLKIVANKFSRFYIFVIRGTPMMVQSLILYNAVFGLFKRTGMSVSDINRVWPLFLAGLVTVSLNSTAYLAEVLRGGILAVDAGQMEAAEYLLARGKSFARTAYLAFGDDEETINLGALAIAEHLKAQGVTLEFVLDEGGCKIEPGTAFGAPETSIVSVQLMEKGYADLELSVHSIGGHSSRPYGGTSLGRLSGAIADITRAPFAVRLNSAMTGAFETLASYITQEPLKTLVQDVAGNADAIAACCMGSPDLFPFVTTTIAPTMIRGGSAACNVMPQDMTAVINFRLADGDTVESVMAHCREAVQDKGVEMRFLQANDPSAIAKRDGYGYRTVVESFQRYYPEAVFIPSMTVGATDAHRYEEICDTCLRCSPFMTEPAEAASGVHGTNERLLVRSYLQGIRVLIDLMEHANVEP